jgi:hypothetical protein
MASSHVLGSATRSARQSEENGSRHPAGSFSSGKWCAQLPSTQRIALVTSVGVGSKRAS